MLRPNHFTVQGVGLRGMYLQSQGGFRWTIKCYWRGCVISQKISAG